MEKRELCCTLGGNINWYSHDGRQYGDYIKIKNTTPIWSSNPTSRHIPEGTETEKETCTPILTAALFIIARTRKQPRCPLTDEWIKKWWYIYAMEYYSAIQRNTFEPVLMRWMKLEPIIHSEVSQKEEYKYRILTHIYGIWRNGTDEFIFRTAMEKQT